MRVLLLGDCNNPHTRKWYGALRSRGHDVALFSFTGPNLECESQFDQGSLYSLNLDPQFPVMSSPIKKALTYLRSLPLLRRIVRQWQPDVVNAHYASSYGLVAALARLRPLAISVWGHDVYDWPKSSFLHAAMMRWLLNSASMVLSTSHAMKVVARKFTVRQIVVTPFGVDIEKFSPAEDRSTHGRKGVICIGTVKTLQEKYGIEYLIRAFALLIARAGGEHVHLHIFGDGRLRGYLESLADELDLSSHVTFHGRIPQDDVPDAFRRLDVAVFPSVYESESFGVAAIEAQACGLPIVASQVGGLPEVVVHGSTGLLVPPRDIKSLADAIWRIISSDDLRQRMGLAAREHIVANYELNSCVLAMESAYCELRSAN